LIHGGVLKPGDRLPSERKIEEKLGIPRGPINRAFRRLETYGILKTVPQSGTYVARIGVDALEGLLANVLKLEDQDFQALVDTRRVLEVYAVELLAQRATDEEIRELEELQKSIAAKIKDGVTSFDEDMVFHLKIAEFSKNPVLKSILTLLVSEVIQQFKEFEQSIGRQRVLQRLLQAIQEHEAVIAAVRDRNPECAAESMRRHFQRSNEYRDQVMRKKSGA
jgi:GntR family transcriptional repressor for pyruvate dehydrogenase complex